MVVSNTPELYVKHTNDIHPDNIQDYNKWERIENPDGTFILSYVDGNKKVQYLTAMGENFLQIAPNVATKFMESSRNTFDIDTEYSLCIDYNKQYNRPILMVYPNRVLYNETIFFVQLSNKVI
jgi:hypothetical protein